MLADDSDKVRTAGASSGMASRTSVPERTLESVSKPLVGIPWRTTGEEQAGLRQKLDYYFAAVHAAGGEPKEVSLQQSNDALKAQIARLDGFMLPGSPVDVDPALYRAAKHEKTKNLDANRDRTDSTILEHAFATGKPVLGICYGCQILNVYLKGTLVQDIPAERQGAGKHGRTDLAPGAVADDLEHKAKLAPGSHLAELARGTEAKINSSHHQAIDQPGNGLKVTAIAGEDGIVEGVEWTAGPNWVVGVQWHPERMVGDGFAERLFGEFVEATRSAKKLAAR
jgi:putative glutamine amidotransferase